jgi:hypothetical protein
MNPVGATTAASGVGAAAVSVLVWGLGLVHITIPADVAGALVMLIAAGAHWVATIATKPAAPAPAPVPVTPAQ